MIIDAHVHSFERLSGLTGRGEVRSIGFGKIRYGTGEEERMTPPSFINNSFPGEVVVEYMDWIGVGKAVLCQGTLYGFHNEYVSSLVRRWPKRFVGCVLVDPILENSVEILKYAIEGLGLRALKLELSEFCGLLGLHPQLKLNHPKLQRFWKSFASYDLPLIIDLGPVASKSYQLEELEKVLSSHTGIRTVIICHLGGICAKDEVSKKIEERWMEFLSMAQRRGFYLDLASLPTFFNEEYPCPIAQKYVEIAFKTLGAEHLLWGSDIPGTLTRVTYRQALDIVRGHCTFFSSSEKRLILGENAHRIYQF